MQLNYFLFSHWFLSAWKILFDFNGSFEPVCWFCALKALSHDVCEKESSMNGIDDLVIVVDPKPTQRAFNFARMRAEALNGGIRQDQAQSCMYSHQSSKDCLADKNNGFPYRFLGGVPSWDVLKLPSTVETEIRIYTDSELKAELIYNGFPR